MLTTAPQLQIDALASGDESTVREIFDSMSPESRFFRFLQAMPRLTNSMLDVLTTVDGRRHRAFVARVGGDPVGVVRLITDSQGETELSVAVIDRAQGRGIGGSLVQYALAEAAAQDIGEITLLVHPQNLASRTMFRRMGATFRLEDGLLIGRLPTEPVAEAA